MIFSKLLSLPLAYDLVQSAIGVGAAKRWFVRERMRPFPGMRVLDVGCGTAAILDKLPQDIHYVGFDPSAAYVASARRRHGDRGRFVVATIADFRLPEHGDFDVVIAHGVLHHIDDGTAGQLMLLASRSLRDQGRLLTADGGWVQGQPRTARWLLSLDRGRFVRTPERYCELARPFFARTEMTVMHHLTNVPYTYCVMECIRP